MEARKCDVCGGFFLPYIASNKIGGKSDSYNEIIVKEKSILEMHEMDNGEETGRITEKKVIYVLEGFKGLEKGYCILGLKEVEEV